MWWSVGVPGKPEPFSGGPWHGQEIDGESGAAAQAVIPERSRHYKELGGGEGASSRFRVRAPA